MKHSAIRIFADEPDCSDTPRTEHNWEFSACSGAKEELPKDAPEPLGKPVVTATYVDESAPLHDDRKVGIGGSTFFQQDSNQLACKETRCSRDGHMVLLLQGQQQSKSPMIAFC
jgi:hypothetical protein